MKCVDTDFLIAVLKGDLGVRKKAEELDKEGRNATTSMNAFELYVGSHLLKKKRHDLKEVKSLLSRFDVLSLDKDGAEKAGEIYAHLLDKGETIDIRDSIIAGIALNNACTLVTRDKHFERVKGLSVEKW
ncbi:MAG: type II toxin-antitoxin system VapC family toxin [Methanocellales archaeon]|nr:type II toxin-antitoxin system VapC family toxin [Methanocellales archaeon]